MRGAIGADEADGLAAGAGAAGAADAVGVIHRRARQVVVDHGRQAGDVDAARGHVGGHQDLQTAGLEIGQHLAALSLAAIPMQRGGADAGGLQLAGHPVGAMPAGHEDQHALPAMGVQQMAQQQGALRRVHLDHALADVRRGGVTWRDVDALRLIQQLFRQRAHRGREGGGEQQVLAVGRQQGQHAAQFVGEAEVEQAVGFVQHQGFDGGKPQRIVRQQVQQPAGRGGDNVGAAAQGHHLRIDGDAAENHGDLGPARQVPASWRRVSPTCAASSRVGSRISVCVWRGVA